MVSSSREATTTRPEDREEVHARTAADESTAALLREAPQIPCYKYIYKYYYNC